MHVGALTGHIDAALVALYAFWIFFAGLIWYLRREDRREGYPLESEVPAPAGRDRQQQFLLMPEPKTFILPDGSTYQAPPGHPDRRDLALRKTASFPGAPFEPTGDPMLDGVGPASYVDRDEAPDLTFEGLPKIVPMRVATDFWVEQRDADPRGMTVIGADRQIAGKVRDLWIDRGEPQIRYLEVEVNGGGRTALLPMTLARVNGRRGEVTVRSILARQFANVPAIANPDQVTRREEDKILGYFAGGNLYATPSRAEPMF